MLRDFYFEYSQILLDEADEERANSDASKRTAEISPKEALREPFIQLFFATYTAAALGHPRSRMQYITFFLQSGLLPSKKILSYALFGEEADLFGSYGYLQYVSPDILTYATYEGKMTEGHYMKQLALGQSSMHLWIASQQQVIKPPDQSNLLTESMSIFQNI